MNVFVDTSVWSLALRREPAVESRETEVLRRALEGEHAVFTTGLVLQEILQGLRGPRARQQILSRFSLLPFITPEREDHVEAAELRNRCRRRGVQVGTIDALLAQLCIRHDLRLLAADRDFLNMSRWCPLSLLQA